MEALSSEQLFCTLKQYAESSSAVIGLDDDISSALTTLKDQRINGKNAIKLTTQDFFNLGIPYGVAMDLKALIDAVKEDMLSDKTIKSSKGALGSLEAQQSTDDHGDKYEEIMKYFSTEEFMEMSEYDKEVHMNIKRKYEATTAKAPLGMVVPIPQFMQPKKKLKITDNRNNQDAGSSRESFSSGAEFFANQSFAQQQKQLAQQDKTVSKPKVLSECQNKPILKKVKPKLKEDDFVAKLPSYDIDSILSKTKGRNIRELEKSLKENAILTTAHSKLLIRTLVLRVFCGSDGSYNSSVTSDQKEGLAASIVKRFPFFADTTDKGKWTWWRVYDRKMNRGRIPNVISHLQRKGDDKDCAAEPDNEDDPDSINDGASTSPGASAPASKVDDFFWLSLVVPNAGERKNILKGMKDSFAARKAWIQSTHPTINDVLDKFPHLVSYDGELIEEEFKLLHPDLNHSALLQTLPVFISKLKSFETLPPLDDDITNGKSLIGFYRTKIIVLM
ncbi:uncharacterized protein LOC117644063 [Thrips palmi]|uniref:Uncharacterized protein LOC117644063 n=1 Tax=Thrips palmi TaxID=161013 RepID=A0A6P8ZLN0_THRPL|nr:uncharacterized protein LOC117644063 [Thrips palmi]